MSKHQKNTLSKTLSLLPGGEGSWDREGIREAIRSLLGLGLRACVAIWSFSEDITPDAEAAGVVLAIHPDDPPFSLFGHAWYPADDARYIIQQVEPVEWFDDVPDRMAPDQTMISLRWFAVRPSNQFVHLEYSARIRRFVLRSSIVGR